MQPEQTKNTEENTFNQPEPEQVSIDSQNEVKAETETVTPSAEAEEVAAVAEPKNRRRGVVAAIVVITLIALAGAAFWWYQQTSGKQMEIGGVTYPSVVARVNGEAVKVEDFKQSYEQALAIAQQQGFDPNTNEEVRSEVEKQALLVAVNTVLMLQKAKEAGYNVTDEEVQAEVATLETQFGGKEQLAAALAGVGLDEAGMLEDIKEQLVIEKFVSESPELQEVPEVTDEEVKTYYDTVAPQIENAPPFEEVSEMIRMQLASEKEQVAIESLLERIRNDANIEELI